MGLFEDMGFFETIEFLKHNGLESQVNKYIAYYIFEKLFGIIVVIGIIWYIRHQIKYYKYKMYQEQQQAELTKNMNEYYRNHKGK